MTAILVYPVLSAAQWHFASKQMRSPSAWCGNVVSDPFAILVNWVSPLAAACVSWLLWRSLKSRRWPVAAVAGLVIFLATTAGLIAEGMWLKETCGLPLHRTWWCPWL